MRKFVLALFCFIAPVWIAHADGLVEPPAKGACDVEVISSLHYGRDADSSQQDVYVQGDDGRFIHYLYDDDKRLTGKLFGDDSGIGMRLFFDYGADGVVSKTTIDDGCSESCDDIDGVTARKIITVRSDEDFIEVSEGYCDLSTGDEVVLRRSVQEYTSAGDIEQQTLYDASGEYWYGQLFYNDDIGGATAVIDSVGRACCAEFDQQGRITGWQGDGTHRKQYHYDDSDHLFCVNELDADGQCSATLFYNDRGDVTSSQDDAGNVTNCEYDAQGRLSRVVYPSVLDSSDTPYSPTIERQYDPLGNITSQTDCNGNITTAEYNADGKPVKVLFADGTSCSFTYNPNGTLREATDRNGVITRHSYDFLSRVTAKETISSDGEFIRQETYSYTIFGLSSCTDGAGNTMHLSNDQAGRLVEVVRETGTGSSKTTYHYDPRGNIIKQREFVGRAEEDTLTTVYHRDENDAVVSEALETSNGATQLVNRPGTDSSANESLYTAIVINDRDEQVLETTTLGANGTFTVTTFDAMKRPETVLQRDPQGCLLSLCELRHDGVGNKVQETNYRIIDGEVVGSAMTRWQYGPCSRLEAVTEDAGTSSETTTVYQHNSLGQLATIIKADGTSISMTYDALGRLSHRLSQDGTIHYEYQYDSCDRLTEVIDHVNNTTTMRSYGADNKVLSEVLGNGLALGNHYDSKGRRDKVTFSDGSSVEYRYHGFLLEEVKRVGANFADGYSHRYADYDLSGNLLSSLMIGQTGTMTFEWSSDIGKLENISTAYWTENIPLMSYEGGNITQMQTNDYVGTLNHFYEYDPLGHVTDEVGVEEGHYQYDSLDNCIDDGYGCVVNTTNQVVRQGDTLYHYDANGNLIEKERQGVRTLLRYDALDRLVEIKESRDWRICYSYDAFDRRLEEKRYRWDVSGTWVPETHCRYLYDGDNEIGIVDDEGVTKQLRILGLGHGAEIGAAVAIEIADEAGVKTFAPIHNHLGSVVCLVDPDTQTPVELYRYSAFGKEHLYDDDGALSTESNVGNPWRFSSKHTDSKSGMVYFGKRYYDPSLGRWITKDPLGCPDGPNRYAYVNSNPVNAIDPYGLFSVGGLWQNVSATWNGCTGFVKSAASASCQFVSDQFSIFDRAHSHAEDVIESILGESTMFLAGHKTTVPRFGCLGKGEVSDLVRVTFLNGLMTPEDHHCCQLQLLSEAHGNVNVHYVYEATRGWTWDMSRGILTKFLGFVSQPAQMMAAKWKALIGEMGGTDGGGVILHYTHSNGAADTYYALKLLTPAEQQMIRVYTFGASMIITDDYCQSATNFISCRDGVPLIDPIGLAKEALQAGPNIVLLSSIWDGPPIVDHLFCYDTYRIKWEQLGQEFVETYGSL